MNKLVYLGAVSLLALCCAGEAMAMDSAPGENWAKKATRKLSTAGEVLKGALARKTAVAIHEDAPQAPVDAAQAVTLSVPLPPEGTPPERLLRKPFVDMWGMPGSRVAVEVGLMSPKDGPLVHQAVQDLIEGSGQFEAVRRESEKRPDVAHSTMGPDFDHYFADYQLFDLNTGTPLTYVGANGKVKPLEVKVTYYSQKVPSTPVRLAPATPLEPESAAAHTAPATGQDDLAVPVVLQPAGQAAGLSSATAGAPDQADRSRMDVLRSVAHDPQNSASVSKPGTGGNLEFEEVGCADLKSIFALELMDEVKGVAGKVKIGRLLVSHKAPRALFDVIKPVVDGNPHVVAVLGESGSRPMNTTSANAKSTLASYTLYDSRPGRGVITRQEGGKPIKFELTFTEDL